MPLVGHLARHTGIIIIDPYNTGDVDQMLLLSSGEKNQNPYGQLIELEPGCDRSNEELEDQKKHRNFQEFFPPKGVSPGTYSIHLP